VYKRTDRGRPDRLMQDLKRARDFGALMRGLSQAARSTSGLGPALGVFCVRLRALLGADAIELWRHERGAGELVLAAWAGDGAAPGRRRVATITAGTHEVAALRRDGPDVRRHDGRTIDIALALRGRRRALGTLVVIGVHATRAGEVAVLERVEQVRRELSSLLENAQLLEEVLRSHRELHEALKSLADLERRVSQSEKLVALGQFVAGIAHELNNPLQGVLGHLELLQAAPGLDPSLRRDVGLVYREADRAARIVRNLLVFAGSGRLNARALNVNNLITRVLRLRRAALQRAGIVVTRALSRQMPVVRGDALLLQQALLNVVLNAEQAMNGPGRLVVRSTGTTSGGVARLVVQDSGPGLTPDVRSRLFEPFFTTKDVGKGTGLGLAIAYGIVQAHGGTIDADNHPSGGARFVLTLPLASTLTRRRRGDFTPPRRGSPKRGRRRPALS
jgi:signal transduction histidine kinase